MADQLEWREADLTPYKVIEAEYAADLKSAETGEGHAVLVIRRIKGGGLQAGIWRWLGGAFTDLEHLKEALQAYADRHGDRLYLPREIVGPDGPRDLSHDGA